MERLSIQNLARNYSIETTVGQAQRIRHFDEVVSPGTRIYIPHTPHTTFVEMIRLQARVRREGMEPVPHIVARRMESLAAVDGLLARFSGEAGVTQALVVAGDIEKPTGPLYSTLEILESGALEKHGITTIGVA